MQARPCRLPVFRDWTVGTGIAVCAVLASLAGCASLPNSGPTTDQVVAQAVQDGHARFALVDVNAKVVSTLLAQPVESFQSRFGSLPPPPEQTVHVGDTIRVEIWQAVDTDSAGQTSTDHGSGTTQSETIPGQIVMRDGAIVVPYAGRVPVVGRTAAQIEDTIQDRLAEQMVKPQVIVSIDKSDANTVTVSGEVTGGARVQLSPRGNRLLEVIAGAGGIKAPPYELSVRLVRGTVTGTIPYDELVTDPAENIYAYPGDVITLTRVPKTFDAFGATGKNLEYPFDADHITLAQALAKTAGLESSRADPAGVFLLRNERSSLVEKLTSAPTLSADSTGHIPVVYHLDMNDINSYLLAQQFAMRDKDVIYVAEAPADALQKLLALIGDISNPVLTGIIVSK